jgi:hypothetical protein
MTRARDVANIDGILTTTGDTYFASAAATPARLGIGAAGTYLTSNGTIPSWGSVSAGGMTLLSTTSLTGVSTVTISSINQTYQNIQFSIENVGWTGTTYLRVRPNDTNTIKATAFEGTVVASFSQNLATQANYSSPAVFTYIIDNYASTTSIKPLKVYGAAGLDTQFFGGGFWNATTAITSVVISNGAGSNFTSGTVKVWGIK